MALQSNDFTQKPKNDLSSHLLKEGNSYRPSVPIYVYRQLVEELDKTKLNLETLKNQNQALIAQNQALKEEVATIIDSTQNLQNILENKDSLLKSPKNRLVTESKKGFSKILLTTESPLAEIPSPEVAKEEHILEVEYTDSIKPSNSGQNKQVKGWWLIILISFLIFSCFLGSFFVAKSFLKDNNNSK